MEDIIIIYNNTIDNGDNILDKFNTIYPNPNFTIEREKNNMLNYLDINIQKVKFHNNYKFNFNIYRKSTTSKLSINYFFNSFFP